MNIQTTTTVHPGNSHLGKLRWEINETETMTLIIICCKSVILASTSLYTVLRAVHFDFGFCGICLLQKVSYHSPCHSFAPSLRGRLCKLKKTSFGCFVIYVQWFIGRMLQAEFITLLSTILLICGAQIFLVFNWPSVISVCIIYAVPAELGRTHKSSAAKGIARMVTKSVINLQWIQWDSWRFCVQSETTWSSIYTT